MSLSLAGADLSVMVPIDERNMIALGFEAEQAWYDFSDLSLTNPQLSSTPVDKLWDDVRSFETSLAWFHTLDDSWSFFVSGQVQSAGEDGASFEDTLTFGGIVAASYRLSDSLEIGLGVIAMSQLEDDVMVLPIPSVRWQIDEKWLLATEGLGLKLSYQLNDTVTLSADGGFWSRNFRLSEDNAASEGIGRHQGFPVRLTLDWQFLSQGRLWVSGGYMFGQELELDTKDGNEIGSFDIDGAPMIGVGFSWEF